MTSLFLLQKYCSPIRLLNFSTWRINGSQMTVTTIANNNGISIPQDLPSQSWLRSQLSSSLEHHMAYRCAVRKYGTLLYRYGGDLAHALTVLLARNRGRQSGNDESNIDDIDNESLTQVCIKLNTKCHAQISKLIQEDSLNPHRIEQFELDKFIGSLDPDIWKAVCLITRPSSRKENTTHVRKVRRVFATCVMLFTINRQCSFSLHTAIADAVESCGGSTGLQQLLNHVGACASIDTHARYVQHRVQEKSKQGAMACYPATSFTAVSTDNLDFIHKYSRVYSGNQGCSWHGTTVQIVQPKPTTLVDTVPHTTSELSELDKGITKRLYSTLSPNRSLRSPCPKTARRRRTGFLDDLHISSSCSTGIVSPLIPASTQRKGLTMTHIKVSKDEDNS